VSSPLQLGTSTVVENWRTGCRPKPKQKWRIVYASSPKRVRISIVKLLEAEGKNSRVKKGSG